MRILISNYRYFISGGPERYLFNVSEELSRRGHTVIPFSVRYRRNRTTPYEKYFVDPIGGDDEVLFREHAKTPKTIVRLLKRAFYDPEVEKASYRVAKETHPDVAYVLHYLRKMSPAVLVGLKRAGVPIVVRLSDYAMVCPEAHCFRNDKPCDECVSGRLWPSVRHRCVQHSLMASAINAVATAVHRWRHYFDLIDMFVVTNPFMAQLMESAGYKKERMVCIYPKGGDAISTLTTREILAAHGREVVFLGGIGGRLYFESGAVILAKVKI